MGPAIRILNSHADIQFCVFRNNYAGMAGGAMLIDSSNITLSDCVFYQNNATSVSDDFASSGGAIYYAGSDAHHMLIERCIFQENSAQHNGGAITAEPNAIHRGPQYFKIYDSVFQDNVANGEGPCLTSTSCDASGGALYLSVADIQIVRTNFFNNRASAPDSTKMATGGALFATNIFGTRSKLAATVIQDCNFTGNGAFGTGGAIYGASQPLQINNTWFQENFVTSANPLFTDMPTYGGAVWYGGSSGVTSVTNSTFYRNYARSGWGGAFFIAESATVFIQFCKFLRNKVISSYTNAGSGGAIMATGSSVLRVLDSSFSHNAASPDLTTSPLAYSGSAGAVFGQSSSITLERCVFTGNRAFTGQFDSGSSGGAVTLEDCYPAKLEQCVFHSNAAAGFLGKSQYASPGTGGGLYIKFSSANITKCAFFSNWVSAGGSQNALGGGMSSK